MILGYDHAIYLAAAADGLDAAARHFADLGFTVTERDDAGKEGAATAQKLVCLADGSYIEILAIRDAEARNRHRYRPDLADGDGWADHSVFTDDLDGVRQDLGRAGMPYSGPHRHERRLRSGEPWGVELILPGIGAGHPALPFVIRDVEGRGLRIPAQGVTHANGVTGTAGVAVAVEDLEAAAQQLSVLFGPATPSDGGLHRTGRAFRFAVGPHWLDVVEPGGGATQGMQALFLKRPGANGVTWLAQGRQALAVVGG